MAYGQNTKLKVTAYLVFNIIVSITIILLNKWIYTNIGFPNITLSMLHFVTTFLGLCICERLNVFAVKSVHLNNLILLALSFCGFVVFTNLSLQTNTVGIFQVAKVLTTPGVVFIQMIYYHKHFSLSIKLTLLPVIIGVIITFYYDIKFNILGTIYASLGVTITSLYQVLVSTKQSELQMNSMQLLYYQAPLSAIMLCFCIPVLEPPLETLRHSWMLIEMVMVFISCLAAFFCNLSTYWIIGNTSPLTYNMVGHLKFVLITLGGWVIFKDEVNLNQLIGIVMTLTGIILYTHVKMKETTKKNLLITNRELKT